MWIYNYLWNVLVIIGRPYTPPPHPHTHTPFPASVVTQKCHTFHCQCSIFTNKCIIFYKIIKKQQVYRITFKVKFLSIFIQNIYLRGGENLKRITLKITA